MWASYDTEGEAVQHGAEMLFGNIGLVVSMVAIVSSPAWGGDLQLPGTYKLISSTRKIIETGQVTSAYGEHPSGSVSYGKDGRMFAVIVFDPEERPRPESIEKTTDAERAKLLRTMVAYGGTYKFDGHTVEHHIEFSWNQVWTGTTVVRDVQVDGDKLIYTSRPAPFSADGKMSVINVI